MVGVVAPDDVVPGVELGQAGVRKTVGADPAAVDEPDELGSDAPAAENEAVAADLLAHGLDVAPEGPDEVLPRPPEVAGVGVVPLVAQVAQGIDLEIVPAHVPQAPIDGPDDGVDGLLRILRNEGGRASGGIFNLGNPAADLSIRELAQQLLEAVGTYPEFAPRARDAKIVEVSSRDYYGENYQDITTRVPSIRKAERLLGWKPTTDFPTGLKKTLDFYLKSRKPPEV